MNNGNIYVEDYLHARNPVPNNGQQHENKQHDMIENVRDYTELIDGLIAAKNGRKIAFLGDLYMIFTCIRINENNIPHKQFRYMESIQHPDPVDGRAGFEYNHLYDKYKNDHFVQEYDCIWHSIAVKIGSEYVIIHNKKIMCRWCRTLDWAILGFCRKCHTIHSFECDKEENKNITFQRTGFDEGMCNHDGNEPVENDNRKAHRVVNVHKSRCESRMDELSDFAYNMGIFLVVLIPLGGVPYDENWDLYNFVTVIISIVLAIAFASYDVYVKNIFSTSFIANDGNRLYYPKFFETMIVVQNRGKNGTSGLPGEFASSRLYNKHRVANNEDDEKDDYKVANGPIEEKTDEEIKKYLRNLRDDALTYNRNYRHKMRQITQIIIVGTLLLCLFACIAALVVTSYYFDHDKKYATIAFLLATKPVTFLWVCFKIQEFCRDGHVFSFGNLPATIVAAIKSYKIECYEQNRRQ